MTAILRLTNLKWAWLALILVALFAFGSYDVVTAQEDGTCSDGIDNNGNGLVDLADPACTTLSEATPAPTAEPTAQTTEPATQEPTDAPTIAPTVVVTPTTLPDTGGDPGQGGSSADQAGVSFATYETETGLIGLLVSALMTVLTITGLTLSSQAKRLAALVIGVGAALVFVFVRNDVEVTTASIGAAVFTVLAASQVGYLMADGLLKSVLPTSEAFKKDDAAKNG